MLYQETIAYLDSFIDYEKTGFEDSLSHFKLERMEKLLGLLGDPQKGLKVIHVAGTKGKGSTSAYIASILKEAGFRVGLYTSPHLSSFRERIVINGEVIEEDVLNEIVEDGRESFEVLRGDKLSFFEVYTAIAFLYFKIERVDFAVVEVGLGGRLDATNTVDSMVSVITPISLEHTNILGRSLSEIASEKAGIIKKDSVCISSPQYLKVSEVIEERCREKKNSLFIVGRDIKIDRIRFHEERQSFDISGRRGKYPLLQSGLIGEHQVVNAAAAIAAIEALAIYNYNIPESAIRNGISKTEWPGRLEIIRRDPRIVLDGAQNEASAKVLANTIKDYFTYDKLFLVLGVSRDKDLRGMCDALRDITDYALLTRADNPRAVDPKYLKEYFTDDTTEIYMNSEDAFKSACDRAAKDDLILVTGSLYLVGEVRARIKR